MDPSQALRTALSCMFSLHWYGLAGLCTFVAFSILKSAFPTSGTIHLYADASSKWLFIYLAIVTYKVGVCIRQHANAILSGETSMIRRGIDQNVAILVARAQTTEAELRKVQAVIQAVSQDPRTYQAENQRLINTERELREQLRALTDQNANLLNEQRELEAQLQEIQEENANLLEHQYDLEMHLQDDGDENGNVEWVDVQDHELNPAAVRQGLENGDREGAH
jgi:hypothetical protein